MRLFAPLRVIAAATLLACGSPAFAAGTTWPDAPYSYFANDVKLETVLADFATGFSLSLSMQPDVRGTVSGRFAAQTPTEFISKLAGIYGFVWYTHAGTLFVSRASDIVTRGVTAPGGNVGSMRKALSDLGVFEPRFGWGELADHGMALVSGPPSYVQLIEGTIRNLPARAQQLTVFRLKHASADDRTVNYRDQQMKVPGLATILRTMVAGGGIAQASTTSAGVGMGAALRPGASFGDTGNGTSAGPGASTAQSSPQIGSTTVVSGGPRPSIQAEPRLNAIIIQDLPERMPLYEQLIAQLDVPTAMVEIEAMIIDISTDRASELGVNWSGRVGRTSLSFGVPTTADTGGLLSFTSGSTAAGNFLISQLRLLETKGDAEIRGRPSVLTSENLTALLDLSETFYIRTQGERVANVTPVTSGTTLRVTPYVVVHEGRTMVRLKIDIEDGHITTRQVDTLPTVSRASVSTEATVLEGEALLIAGYSSDQNALSKQQVPVLGDIPGLGALFSSNSRSVQKRERMFLIRPKVVGFPGQAAAKAVLPEEISTRKPGAW